MESTAVVNNQDNYQEVDNSSETSKEYASSNSSFVEDTKKRNSLISFEDDKGKDKDNNPDEKDEKIKTKRSKRNSFRKMFKKDGKGEKDEKEGGKEGGIVRSLSFFNKDKDKRNNSIVESEKHLRSTSRASTNNDTHKHRFSFFSDDDDKLETSTAPKSRRSSNPENVEKDNSINKHRNRLSVNLGNLHIGKMFKGSDENKPPKQIKPLEDIFLEPDETTASPRSPRGSFNAGSSSILKNKQNDYVESPRHDNFSRDYSKNNFTDESPNDDVQSINSSTRPSSFDEYNPDDDDKIDEPTSPNTPRLTVTHPRQDEQDHKSDDEIDDSNIEPKRRNLKIITNITDDDNDITQSSNKNSKFNLFRENTKSVNNSNNEQILEKLQELENINKSLNDAKAQLEAKVAEQDDQIGKFNSVEQIMQQQIDLSKRMTETMHRLESKSNAQNEEFESSNVGKVFEDTIKRLEDKIDKQNEEISQLRSIVGQLTGKQQFFLTNGDFSMEPKLIMTNQEEEETHSLIQTNQSSQAYSNTLVNTLVVSPICMSATIAASVLHAVYVRPVIGLIKVVKEISTAGRDLVIVT